MYPGIAHCHGSSGPALIPKPFYNKLLFIVVIALILLKYQSLCRFRDFMGALNLCTPNHYYPGSSEPTPIAKPLYTQTSLLIVAVALHLLQHPKGPRCLCLQQGLQTFLLLLALACVPWMLIIKPVLLRQQHLGKLKVGQCVLLCDQGRIQDFSRVGSISPSQGHPDAVLTYIYITL